MTESGSTLDTSKVTQCDRTFPSVYHCKEVHGRRESVPVLRCKSSLQMSKYTVNHSEDLRALKCFLSESVSQPSGSRMTKTLTGVLSSSSSGSQPIPPRAAAKSQDCANIGPTPKMASIQMSSKCAFCLKPRECLSRE